MKNTIKTNRTLTVENITRNSARLSASRYCVYLVIKTQPMKPLQFLPCERGGGFAQGKLGGWRYGLLQNICLNDSSRWRKS